MTGRKDEWAEIRGIANSREVGGRLTPGAPERVEPTAHVPHVRAWSDAGSDPLDDMREYARMVLDAPVVYRAMEVGEGVMRLLRQMADEPRYATLPMWGVPMTQVDDLAPLAWRTVEYRNGERTVISEHDAGAVQG